MVDGSIIYRGALCGDYQDISVHSWERAQFVPDMKLLQTINLSSIRRAPEEFMDEERRDFLFEKVHPAVSIREKIYHRHINYGSVYFRVFTCPSGEPIDHVTIEEEEASLRNYVHQPTI